MQVILLEDLDRIGHEGDVLTVADGFARNYLIPKKLAVHATKGALKDLELRRKAISQREDDKRTRALRDADELAAKQVTVKARAGEGDRLHGQVTPQMIATAALEQHKLQIDRRDIDIAEPIRELGDYLISVKLYKKWRPVADQRRPRHARPRRPRRSDGPEVKPAVVYSRSRRPSGGANCRDGADGQGRRGSVEQPRKRRLRSEPPVARSRRGR